MIEYKRNKFMQYMPDIASYYTKLEKVQEKWDSIRLLCEASCPSYAKSIVESMNDIQNKFYLLQNELFEKLMDKAIHGFYQKNIAKAQLAIDILIRNLYERTADVGFLTTDNEICKFIKSPDEETKAYIVAKLTDYTRKYSVFYDVIIMDAELKVLANQDEERNIVGKVFNDPFLTETLETTESYIEFFGKTMLSNNKDAHMFSGKVVEGNKIIGIICLCFRYLDETKNIFEQLKNINDPSVLSIIDENNVVIASSDENHLNVGTVVERVEKQDVIVLYRGEEYIARTIETKGYQGYFGLNWSGHFMVPLRMAFRDFDSLDKQEEEAINILLKYADTFSDELQNILVQSNDINHLLHRFIFNGKLLMQNNGNLEEERLKPLFEYLYKIGNTITALFNESIHSLFEKVMKVYLQDVGFTACLSMNIMDRNLYERANDCRWWAQKTLFTDVLQKEAITDTDEKVLTNALSFINRLYTVYYNVFLFDRKGKVVAVSNQKEKHQIGKILTDRHIVSTLTNRRQENYYVSPFERTDFYQGQYTYIYCASIIKGAETVGGIGLVFDAADQLKKMLEGALEQKDQYFAFFTDDNGMVLSSTHPAYEVGARLPLQQEVFKLSKGDIHAQIVSQEGIYYAVGRFRSPGYREYKTSDNYKNDVYAFILRKIWDSENKKEEGTEAMVVRQSMITLDKASPVVEFAVFVIGNLYFAFDRQVVETVLENKYMDTAHKGVYIKSLILYKDAPVAVVDSNMLFAKNLSPEIFKHLVILNLEDGKIGLEVSELNSILRVNESQIIKTTGMANQEPLIYGAVPVAVEDTNKIIFIIDTKELEGAIGRRDHIDLKNIKIE